MENPNQSTRTHYEVWTQYESKVWQSDGMNYNEGDLDELERRLDNGGYYYRIIQVTTITERKVVKDTSNG